jgi:Antibiotic biosynthesis monooxygenase
VLVVLRFEAMPGDHDAIGAPAGRTADAAPDELVAAARPALAALAACPGFVRAQLGRAFDEPDVWCLVTEWASVGAYRRALGSYEVKLHATPLLARARPEPSAFEVLADAVAGAPVRLSGSDRAGGTGDGGVAGRIASRP